VRWLFQADWLRPQTLTLLPFLRWDIPQDAARGNRSLPPLHWWLRLAIRRNLDEATLRLYVQVEQDKPAIMREM
jgi:hypothetical protein